MILIGKCKLLKNEKQSFTNKNGQTVDFTKAEWCDDEGNKFSGSVPKNVKIEADKGEGTATFEVTTAQNATGGSYTKFSLIEFVPD